MSTIKQFEDLLCWQRARELTKLVYEQFQSYKFKSLNDQIQRAAVSVMSNIAEGFERGTKQEFLNYLYIAKGSAGEVRAQLYVALDSGYLNPETFKLLNSLVQECSKLIYKLTQGVKVSKFQGQQRQLAVSTKIPDHIKSILESNSAYQKYYNPKTKQIEFWRMAKDKENLETF